MRVTTAATGTSEYRNLPRDHQEGDRKKNKKHKLDSSTGTFMGSGTDDLQHDEQEMIHRFKESYPKETNAHTVGVSEEDSRKSKKVGGKKKKKKKIQ